MTFAEWTHPIWRLPSEITISHNGTMPMQSSTQSPAKEMEYWALVKDPGFQPLWNRGFGNALGRLFQGIRDIPGTDTCFSTTLINIPEDINITYGKIVCDYKPHSQENERARLTVGGVRLDYADNVATSTTDITTFKILINSTLST
jgi:hypothetical protein